MAHKTSLDTKTLISEVMDETTSEAEELIRTNSPPRSEAPDPQQDFKPIHYQADD